MASIPRSSAAGPARAAVTFKDLRLDHSRKRVTRRGTPVELTPQEYSLLRTLVDHCGHALSRGELLALAWGYDYPGETRTVDVHIQHLRKKLGLERDIQTIYRFGYRLRQ